MLSTMLGNWIAMMESVRNPEPLSLAANVEMARSACAKVNVRGAPSVKLSRLDGSTSAIAPGCRADLVVLDATDPALAEHGIDTLLDAAVFGPCRKPVRDVMVGGRWVVRERHHADEDAVLARYRRTIAELSR